jgi:hypothetical protein
MQLIQPSPDLKLENKSSQKIHPALAQFSPDVPEWISHFFSLSCQLSSLFVTLHPH